MAAHWKASAPPLLTAAYVLTGLRLPSAALASLFERVVVHMKESSAYQLILAEGKAEGKAEGEAQGKAAEAKAILLRQRSAIGPGWKMWSYRRTTPTARTP
jgi:predicted transposase YdaD